MFQIIFNVFYVIVAVAMIVLILLQRGPGATAGASFGGGASATVFGARSASGFMGRTTWTLAALFLLMSLGMAWHLSHQGKSTQADLGVMGAVVEEQKAGEVPALPTDVSATPALAPAVENAEVPAVPAQAVDGAVEAVESAVEEQADPNVKGSESE